MSDLERVKQAMIDGEHTDGDLQWAVETIEQVQADNIRLVDELEKQKCNAAFYKCSALCGEKFKDGDEPFPPPKDK